MSTPSRRGRGPLQGPVGGLVAGLLVVLVWRGVSTLLALANGGWAESVVGTMTFVVDALLALGPVALVVILLRRRFGWSSPWAHAAGYGAFLVVHVPLWWYDRAAVWANPAFLDHYFLALAVLTGLATMANHLHTLQAEGRLRWPERAVWTAGLSIAVAFVLLGSALPAAAHTPAFGLDASRGGASRVPIQVPGTPGSSWAILQPFDAGAVLLLERQAPAGEHLEAATLLLSTQPNAHAAFRPVVAVMGPGLPAPTQPLPVPLPAGWGAVVNLTWDARGYEGFTQVPVLRGPSVVVVAPQAGAYRIVVWDPGNHSGEAWIAVGHEEGVRLQDLHIFPAAYLDIHARFW